ncbi:MAG: hypothetical protein RIC19_19860 [Phaeodactylibacter sp.]|uniref:hypothetical protein n=1 Tax=Phaeodactylibacter sp. TaxID=1940289 RepID=UPI0032EB51E7
MTEQQRNRLNTIIEDGYQFDLGEYISKGASLFQKSAGNFIGFAFLAGMILSVASFIPIIGSILTNLVLSPALFVGGYLAAHKLNNKEPLEFGTFFKGFDHVGQLALAALVTNLILFATFIPLLAVWYMYGATDWLYDIFSNPVMAGEPPSFPVWSFLLTLPAIYLSIAYAWSYLFIAFYGMDFWEAMESSRKIISKKWGIFFLFLLILGLMAALGFLFFFVGALVTFPILICANYAAFAEVTELLAEQEDDLVEHLID